MENDQFITSFSIHLYAFIKMKQKKNVHFFVWIFEFLFDQLFFWINKKIIFISFIFHRWLTIYDFAIFFDLFKAKKKMDFDEKKVTAHSHAYGS